MDSRDFYSELALLCCVLDANLLGRYARSSGWSWVLCLWRLTPGQSAERLSRSSAPTVVDGIAAFMALREPVPQADPDWIGPRWTPQQESVFSAGLAEMLAIAMILVGLSGCLLFINLTSLTWPIGSFETCLPAS